MMPLALRYPRKSIAKKSRRPQVPHRSHHPHPQPHQFHRINPPYPRLKNQNLASAIKEVRVNEQMIAQNREKQ